MRRRPSNTVAILLSCYKQPGGSLLQRVTQREAPGSTFDLIETHMQQLNALVNVYRAQGGGWR